jgi:hypothetical protein
LYNRVAICNRSGTIVTIGDSHVSGHFDKCDGRIL